MLDCLEDLVMAKNASKPLKASYLMKASAELEITTLKLRLCLELKLENETRIFQAQSHIREIGRMTGGWLKSLQNESMKSDESPPRDGHRCCRCDSSDRSCPRSPDDCHDSSCRSEHCRRLF